MADNSINHSVCPLGIMDRLWFHQVILFSSQSVPKTLKQPQLVSALLAYPASSSSSSSSGVFISAAQSLPDVKIPPGSPPYSSLDGENDGEVEEGEDEEIKQRERPITRGNRTERRARSVSSSPSTEKRLEKFTRQSKGRQRLQKSMSCRSMGELELEEVKGFMDLGFIFKKEHISPRIMTVLPGLQRLRLHKINLQKSINLKLREDDDDELREEHEQRGIIRPYLSEAWLIKRPDSPLLNLRVPRASAAADMKRHLRFWARTVASVVEQES